MIPTLEEAFQVSHRKGRAQGYEVLSDLPEDLRAGFTFNRIGDLSLITLSPTEEDFEAASSFYKGLSSESRSFFGPSDRFLHPFPEADKDLMLGQFPNYAFETKSNGLIVATFFLRKFRETTEESPRGSGNVVDIIKGEQELKMAELGIGVADEYHGVGLGSLAMDVMEYIARHKDLNAIWLDNFVPNTKGAGLYEHKGYGVVREFMRHNMGTDSDMLAARRLKIL